MSLLDQHFITQFGTEVRNEYQHKGKLDMSMFNIQMGKAERFRFQKHGTADSFEHNPGSELPNKMIDRTNVDLVIKWYNATDILDVTQEQMINYNAKAKLIENIKFAMARRQDYVAFDALKSATYLPANIIPKNISGTDAPLSLKAVQQAAKLLDSNFVPYDNRYMIVHPDQLHYFMSQLQVSSFDYNTNKVLVNGTMDTFYGFKFITLPQFSVDKNSGLYSGIREETVNEYITYFFHGGREGALALAVNNVDGTTRIDYESNKAGYRGLAQIGLASGILDNLSVGKIIGAKAG